MQKVNNIVQLRRDFRVKWYRSPIDKSVLQQLHDRSEARSNEETSNKEPAAPLTLHSTMRGSMQSWSKSSFGAKKIGSRTPKKRENSTVGRLGALGDAPRTP